MYAPRSYTGDGLLSLHAGIELVRASGRALLLEYSIATPIVDDPGDFYEFATNHFFSIAFHTGRASRPLAVAVAHPLMRADGGARIPSAL